MHWSSPGLWEMQSEESRVEPGILGGLSHVRQEKDKKRDREKERNVVTFIDTSSKLLRNNRN